MNRRPSGYEPDELPLLHPATYFEALYSIIEYSHSSLRLGLGFIILRSTRSYTIYARISNLDLRISKLVGRDGFEPSYLAEQIYSLSPLTTRPPAPVKLEQQILMATPIGFEPTISCVTGRRFKPLSYGAPCILVGDDGFEPPTSCL